MAALVLLPLAVGTARAGEKLEWAHRRSGKMGSFGYATAASVAKVAGKYCKDIRFSVSPTQGSTASMKLYGKKDVDSCYASNFQLWQALHNQGPFAKKPLQRKVYQTVYTYTAEYSVMTLKKRDDIKTLSDLKGKKVFMYPAATGPHDLYKKVFKILGMADKVKHVEISLMQAPGPVEIRRGGRGGDLQRGPADPQRLHRKPGHPRRSEDSELQPRRG